MLTGRRTRSRLGPPPQPRESGDRRGSRSGDRGNTHARTSDGNRGSRGTVLLLFPAALLVMVILGAIAIDVGYTTVRGRELRAVAASAANDSLAALDIATLRATGSVVIDESAAHGIVTQAISLGPLPDARVVDVEINGFEIAVTLQLDVELVMAPALGNLERVTLQRTGRAVVLS